MDADALAPPGRPSPPAAPLAAEPVGRAVAAALVAAMARAEPAALGALYDLYGSELYGLIVGMVGDGGEAQEILQETMWQAWRDSERYDPARASVRTWLHMIMRSRVLDWRRRAGARARTTDLGHVEGVEDPTAVEALERVADRHDVLRAAGRLSDAEQRAIALTYFGGLSQAEAARVLGVPLGTLKGRVRSALARLRVALDPASQREDGQ
jgi:RNA polymerase sigma-70 factor (ECF subfamily)